MRNGGRKAIFMHIAEPRAPSIGFTFIAVFNSLKLTMLLLFSHQNTANINFSYNVTKT
jgi:hypothetical protein